MQLQASHLASVWPSFPTHKIGDTHLLTLWSESNELMHVKYLNTVWCRRSANLILALLLQWPKSSFWFTICYGKPRTNFSQYFLLCWKYVSPSQICKSYKWIPDMVSGTRSTPYMSFKSIFYHLSFKQHYIKLYFHLFLEYLDHSFTVVHNMLYSPPILWCSACLLLHKQTLAYFSVLWERF